MIRKWYPQTPGGPEDKQLRRGKEIAQGAHAAMAWLTTRLTYGVTGGTLPDSTKAALWVTEAERTWLQDGFRKITCQVPNEGALLAIYETARAAGLEAFLITDAGDTEFDGVPTHTAVAIGPDYADRIDPVTACLALY